MKIPINKSEKEILKDKRIQKYQWKDIGSAKYGILIEFSGIDKNEQIYELLEVFNVL